MPNLLASRPGRLAAFTGLYFCEGLPQGFATVAVALELKRRGFDAAALGAFSAVILTPWAWKWVAGPLVDNLHLRRFGRRKQWIVLCQALLIAALGLAIVTFPRDGSAAALALFTAAITLANG